MAALKGQNVHVQLHIPEAHSKYENVQPEVSTIRSWPNHVARVGKKQIEDRVLFLLGESARFNLKTHIHDQLKL